MVTALHVRPWATRETCWWAVTGYQIPCVVGASWIQEEFPTPIQMSEGEVSWWLAIREYKGEVPPMMNTQPRHASPLAPTPLSELPPQTFETERLILRAMQADDAELVYATYASDPVVTKYLSFPCASHPDESRPFVQGIAENFAGREGIHQQYGWLVSRKDTGQCIGCVGFGIKDASSLSGGSVFAQSAWGHGFATEAWQPVVDWGKSQPNVLRIEAEHHPDNQASGNVMRKIGLTREGVDPDFCVLPNLGPQRVDMVIWAWTRPTS